jgi:phosphoribosylaminoimidazole-succinocarboxamide synthase
MSRAKDFAPGADAIIIYHGDETAAFGGTKKAIIAGKGVLNNKISAFLFSALRKVGIANHFIELVDDRRQRCRKTTPLAITVIARNHVTEDLAYRLPFKTGARLKNPVYELIYRENRAGDILINDDHALALGLCSLEELKALRKCAEDANKVLTELFARVGVILAEARFSFGRTVNGEILLTGEISPDTCRLWDEKTGKKLDRDRFRYDLGQVIEAYENIWQRLVAIK